MTTPDVRDVLERARRAAPPSDMTFDALVRRRDRRRRRQRLSAATLGLALAAVAATVVFVTFHAGKPATQQPASGGSINLPPATQPPLEAGPGQYYYLREFVYTLASGSQTPDGQMTLAYDRGTVEAWWRADDAGRGLFHWDAGSEAKDTDTTYGPGDFPRETSTLDFPTDTQALLQYLLDRSAPNGSSPAPLVTPPPGGGPRDGQLWRAITDLLDMPNMTPSVRAALLDVGAGLQGAEVDLTAIDPVGRPAYRITLESGDGKGELFVDPASHELLALRMSTDSEGVYELQVTLAAGVSDSTTARPNESSIPPPVRDPSALDAPIHRTIG